MLPEAAEERQFERRPLRLQVTAHTESGAGLGCVTRDLSLGGAFLEAEGVHPHFAAELRLVFQLPESGVLELPAVVRWLSPDGFGVQFGLLGARATQQLVAILGRAAAPVVGLGAASRRPSPGDG